MAESLAEICRVCLSRDQHMRSIDDEKHPIINFAHFLSELTCVTMENDDKLSRCICERCTDRVVDAYNLRTLAKTSDSYLRLAYHSIEHEIQSEQEPKVDETAVLPKLKFTKDKNNHVCSVCGKKFAYESEMKRHQLSHTTVFKCSVCGNTFGFKSALTRHEKQHERTIRQHCSQCGRSFPDAALLHRHIRYAHHDKKHKCLSCDARFGTVSALRTHTSTHAHRQLCCRHAGCGKMFRLPHQRKRHEALHTGHKMHFCKHCGKGFIQAHHLSLHLCTHQPERRLPCPQPGCGDSFPARYSLTRHLHTVHDKILLECDKCKSKFSSKRRLNNHHAKCQNEPNATSISQRNSSSKKSEKTFCVFCNKYFTPKYLKKHQTICKQNTTDLPVTNCNELTQADINENIISSNEEHPNTVAIDPDTQSNELNSVVQEKQSNVDTSNTHNGSLNNETLRCQRVGEVANIEDVDSLCNNCSCNTRDDVSCNAPSEEAKVPSTLQRMESEMMRGNDCQMMLGKCIVGDGADGGGEECICAKVSYEEAPLPEYLTTPLLAALQQQGYYPG